VSNIAFSFRGNEPVRRAFHSAFLHHACEAGMDMGIVNAAHCIEDKYENIDKELLKYVEDVLLNRRADSTERMLEFAATLDPKSKPCALKRLNGEVPKFEATPRQNPITENLIAPPKKVSAVPKYMDWTDHLPMSDTYDILARAD